MGEDRTRWFLMWKSRVMPECWSPADGNIEDFFDPENPHHGGRDESNPIKAAHGEIDDEVPEEDDMNALEMVFGNWRQEKLNKILQSKAENQATIPPSPQSGDMQGDKTQEKVDSTSS